MSLYLVRERLQAGEHVVYFDYDEDDGGKSMAMRLRSLNLDPNLAANLHYFNPQGIGRDGEKWQVLRRMIRKYSPSLVIVDTMAPAMVELGLNETDNAEVGAWYRHAFRLISGVKPRPALVIIDHVTKSGEGRGRWARGAGDKLGRVHAAFAVESTVPFSRTAPGQVNLVIAKDRGGEIGREGDTVALVKFNPSNGGQFLGISIEVPSQASLAELSAGVNAVKAEVRSRIRLQMQSDASQRWWLAKDLKKNAGAKAEVVNEVIEDMIRDGVLWEDLQGRTKVYGLPHMIVDDAE